MIRSILLLLLASLFTINFFAQSEDKRLSDEQMEIRILELLKDSSYVELSYSEIIVMETKDIMNYSKGSGFSITEILNEKIKAETDYIKIHTNLLRQRTKLTWEEIDRKLGLKE